MPWPGLHLLSPGPPWTSASTKPSKTFREMGHDLGPLSPTENLWFTKCISKKRVQQRD